MSRTRASMSCKMLIIETQPLPQHFTQRDQTFITGTTASGSDHELFFDRPDAYATPMCEVKTMSSPHASAGEVSL